jgi:hypothetical protein
MMPKDGWGIGEQPSCQPSFPFQNLPFQKDSFPKSLGFDFIFLFLVVYEESG